MDFPTHLSTIPPQPGHAPENVAEHSGFDNQFNITASLKLATGKPQDSESILSGLLGTIEGSIHNADWSVKVAAWIQVLTLIRQFGNEQTIQQFFNLITTRSDDASGLARFPILAAAENVMNVHTDWSQGKIFLNDLQLAVFLKTFNNPLQIGEQFRLAGSPKKNQADVKTIFSGLCNNIKESIAPFEGERAGQAWTAVLAHIMSLSQYGHKENVQQFFNLLLSSVDDKDLHLIASAANHADSKQWQEVLQSRREIYLKPLEVAAQANDPEALFVLGQAYRDENLRLGIAPDETDHAAAMELFLTQGIARVDTNRAKGNQYFFSLFELIEQLPQCVDTLTVDQTNAYLNVAEKLIETGSRQNIAKAKQIVAVLLINVFDICVDFANDNHSGASSKLAQMVCEEIAKKKGLAACYPSEFQVLQEYALRMNLLRMNIPDFGNSLFRPLEKCDGELAPCLVGIGYSKGADNVPKDFLKALDGLKQPTNGTVWLTTYERYKNVMEQLSFWQRSLVLRQYGDRALAWNALRDGALDAKEPESLLMFAKVHLYNDPFFQSQMDRRLIANYKGNPLPEQIVKEKKQEAIRLLKAVTDQVNDLHAGGMLTRAVKHVVREAAFILYTIYKEDGKVKDAAHHL